MIIVRKVIVVVVVIIIIIILLLLISYALFTYIVQHALKAYTDVTFINFLI